MRTRSSASAAATPPSPRSRSHEAKRESHQTDLPACGGAVATDRSVSAGNWTTGSGPTSAGNSTTGGGISAGNSTLTGGGISGGNSTVTGGGITAGNSTTGGGISAGNSTLTGGGISGGNSTTGGGISAGNSTVTGGGISGGNSTTGGGISAGNSTLTDGGISAGGATMPGNGSNPMGGGDGIRTSTTTMASSMGSTINLVVAGGGSRPELSTMTGGESTAATLMTRDRSNRNGTVVTLGLSSNNIGCGSSYSQTEEVTAQDVRDACVSYKTQRAYRGSLKVISRWIVATKGDQADRFFDCNGQIDLAHFTASDFEAFLLEKRKSVSVGTLSGYRSAIKDLYRRKEIPLPAAYSNSLATFFSGLKRMEAAKFQAGSARESGKHPLPYSLYRHLCRETLARQDGGFTHLFLTTQWNLMCRSESVQTLCTDHLSSHDDSIGCVMHKSKTNQEGNGPKDPRHMYANPRQPETCWITALGLYLACRPTLSPGPLFPGSEQKARFGNILRQLIGELKQQTHYGTHSIRKGVATFACSGSTGGPSIASVCLRVGWSLGGVQDRYIRYEAAGDQYLGRVVAGLPLNSPSFAVLPPHFGDNEDPTVAACVRQMYPSLCETSSVVDVLKLCIASLVKHSVYLRELLPASHPLLSTTLFRDPTMMAALEAVLVSGESPWMQPTGIPPHVELYKQLQGVQRSIDNLPPVLLDGMSALIESKGVAAGNITKELLEKTIAALLERAGVGRDREASELSRTASNGSDMAHYYDGKFHMLPKTFEFPKTGALGAWKLWWFGDNARGYPPLKRIGAHDLPRESMRKVLSDWSSLVRRIVDAAAKAGCEVTSKMTEEQADKIFRVGMDHLPLLPSTRKRRVSELSIGTTLRLAREAHKRSHN